MTITEFLEARIAEDEAIARAAGVRSNEWRAFGRTVQGGEFHEPDPEWGDGPDDGYGSITIVYDEGTPHEDEASHIARNDPTRVLAECAAKRAIIGLADDQLAAEVDRGDASALGASLMHNDTIRALTSAYKEHPDYRQEWAL